MRSIVRMESSYKQFPSMPDARLVRHELTLSDGEVLVLPTVWTLRTFGPQRRFFPQWLWRAFCWLAGANTPEGASDLMGQMLENTMNSASDLVEYSESE